MTCARVTLSYAPLLCAAQCSDTFVMTSVQLPAPKTDTLNRAPLELVVWQVRHERLPDTGPSRALAIRDGLDDQYPNIGQGDTAELIIAPSQMVAGERTTGWQLKSADGLWTVVLMPDFFALESSRYTTWSEFYRRANDLIRVIDEVGGPALIQRVGLRYVDRIITDSAARPHEWEGLLEAPILGMAGHADLGAAVTVAQTVSVMDFGSAQVILRSSCATDANSKNGYSTVLDTDCFTATAEAYDAQRLRTTTNDLHILSLQVFQAVLTKEFYETLRD